MRLGYRVNIFSVKFFLYFNEKVRNIKVKLSFKKLLLNCYGMYINRLIIKINLNLVKCVIFFYFIYLK